MAGEWMTISGFNSTRVFFDSSHSNHERRLNFQCFFFCWYKLFVVGLRNNYDRDYIGFATLPEQVHRKSVKRGFDFTLMVIGETAVLGLANQR